MVMLCMVNIITFISAGIAIFNIIQEGKEKSQKKWNYDEF